MGRIILCGSFKGGVGKSVTTFNLAYSLAEIGKRFCVWISEKRFCVWILTARLISPPALG